MLKEIVQTTVMKQKITERWTPEYLERPGLRVNDKADIIEYTNEPMPYELDDNTIQKHVHECRLKNMLIRP